ncbi:methyltransferase domain-containing protein [Paraglaciecola polaris]|uniref:methyltransferase domain-containing protein n=2 Tax=Paraglaciecola polaris TaxID=222814 RepID=UPI0030ED95F5
MHGTAMVKHVDERPMVNPVNSVTLERRLKSRIAMQFSRAATRYDNAAQVQIDIADDAVVLFTEHTKNDLKKLPRRVLDIGCGTGRVTRQLAATGVNKAQNILAMDLAFGMLQHAEQAWEQPISGQSAPQLSTICWLQGDAEHIPLGDNTLEGVFSSMALQWCKDRTQVCHEINRVLVSGARGVLAIMCAGSMHELDTCWQHIDHTRQINHFASAHDWASSAEKVGLQVQMQQKNYVTWHADVRTLLGSMKQIGANVVTGNGQKKTISRPTLHTLEQYYQEQFGSHQGLPLTYSVCFLQITKP